MAQGKVRLFAKSWVFVPADLGGGDKRISIVFDPSVTGKDDLLNLLVSLADVYRALGGDGLQIRSGGGLSTADLYAGA